MNRQQLLARIDGAWVAFNASYAGLPDAQLMEPGVVGEWSVRDLLAHVSIWEEESLEHLPLIMTGGTPPRYASFGGLDAFNALMIEQKRALSLAEVRWQLDETHRSLVEFLQDVPEEHFARETRFRHRLRLDTYSHYPLHAAAIREWREQRSVR